LSLKIQKRKNPNYCWRIKGANLSELASVVLEDRGNNSVALRGLRREQGQGVGKVLLLLREDAAVVGIVDARGGRVDVARGEGGQSIETLTLLPEKRIP